MDEKEVKEKTKKIIGKGQRALRLGVNIFVYTFVSIFMLFMIFFGISQTSFFKNWLRDTVVEIANEELNGKLSIGEIDGTIFTSLLIKDVTLTSLQKDTVVSAGMIELRTSPLKILFKNIYIRKFELKDAKIKLIEESDGQLNLLKIFPPSTDTDTTTSEFPFTIEVADFALTNIDFSMQRYDKVGSTENYPTLTTEDLRIKNLNLSLNAFADINKYVYRLTINDFSFSPNFNYFQMQHLSGSILLTPQLTGINKLRLITEESDVELSAAISNIDFLKDFSKEKLANAPVRMTLSAPKLNFDDITTFVPPMKMLEGNIVAELEASGTFTELLIKKLNLNYNNTTLNAKANLKNLLDADKMQFDLSITNSTLDPADPNKLLRNLELPEYKDFGVVKIDTLTYKGGPLDFTTTFAIRTDKGSMNGNAKIDLRPVDMIYEAKLFTKNLDLASFTSLPTDVNSEINISGSGFNPQKMKMDVYINANASKIGNKYLSELNLNTTAENGLIKTSINFASDSTKADILANLDFNNPNDPTYELKGKVIGINLAQLLNNQSLNTELNLSIDASGQGFNPDSMDLFLVTDIKDSKFMDFKIDSTRLIMDIRRNDNGKKIINIISDIADLTVSGNFHLTSLGEVFAREGEIIQSVMSEKIDPVFFNDSISVAQKSIIRKLEQKPIDNFAFDYLLDFKESMKINVGESILEIDGLMNGNVKSEYDSIAITLLAQFDYLKFWNDKDVYFLINSKLNTYISNHLIDGYDGVIDATLKFNSDRIYAKGNLYNISSEFNMLGNDIDFSFNGEYEKNIKAKLNANASFDEKQLDLFINEFDLNYNDLNIKNINKIKLSYLNQAINFDDFNLSIADGILSTSGSFGATGEHKLDFSLDSLTGHRVVSDIMGKLGAKDFDTDINLSAELNGNFSNPKFSIIGSAKNIKYGSGNFGSLHSTFEYADNSLNTNIRFLDSLGNQDKPALLVKGYIPLNLFASQDSSDLKKKLLDLTIESDEYDLSSLKDLIPNIQFNKGTLESDIYISGTLEEPIAIGYFSINNAQFKIKKTNLDYDFSTKVWIDDQDISIESIELKNTFGTANGGTLSGKGFVHLNKFKLDSTFVQINGDLKVLDKESKNTSLMVYGDLALKTRGDIVYSSNKEKSYILLPIDVTVAELVVPLSKTAYSSSSGFDYRYLNYNSAKDKLQSELDSLIELANREDEYLNEKIEELKFDYTIDIKLDTEAEIDVVLSKELDQNLSLILGGDFFLESLNGKKKSGGQLNLLEGSTLSFIKTFEANGNIKFDKIDNPIIDITSTYKGYRAIDPNDPSSEQEVAVKIKLKGPLSELNKNFVSDANNVGVYIGRQAIEEDKKDESKNITDAMFFIITGNFPNEANQQQKDLFSGYATDIASSMLGNVLNQYLGNYVKGFQLRQSGSETVFNLRGEAKLFGLTVKYEAGGSSTEVFQDLSRADVKIELPVTQRFQLKVERKKSENETSSTNNTRFIEGAMKYNLEF